MVLPPCSSLLCQQKCRLLYPKGPGALGKGHFSPTGEEIRSSCARWCAHSVPLRSLAVGDLVKGGCRAGPLTRCVTRRHATVGHCLLRLAPSLEAEEAPARGADKTGLWPPKCRPTLISCLWTRKPMVRIPGHFLGSPDQPPFGPQLAESRFWGRHELAETLPLLGNPEAPLPPYEDHWVTT